MSATIDAAWANSSLEMRRDAVFAQMIAAPSDTSLMLEYARLSVELRDYEAAVGTLERLVDLDPASIDARFELAVAYFSLGVNELADHHLKILAESAALTAEQAEEVALYRREIEQRSSPSRVNAYLELGGARLTGIGDSGLKGSFGLTHRFDLGDANATEWITNFRADSLQFGSNSTSNQWGVFLRSGPVFRASGEAFGLTLRPFLDLRHLDDVDGDQFSAAGLGLGFEYPSSVNWTFFGEVTGGWIEYDQPVADGNFVGGALGASNALSRQTRLRLILRGQSSDVGLAQQDRDRYGARLDLTHRFNGWLSGAKRDWVANLYVQSDQEEFGSGREDDLFGAGASMTAYLRPNLYLEPAIEHFERSSSQFGFDTDETVLSIVLGVEF